MQLSPTFILLIHLLTYNPFFPYIAMNQSSNIFFMSGAISPPYPHSVNPSIFMAILSRLLIFTPSLARTLIFGIYTMPNPIFQSALLRRLNLSLLVVLYMVL
jgi:hypothetical protein